MTKLHRLLKRQLKKGLGVDYIPEYLAGFVYLINSAYYEFENERDLMERSIEISSREYNERTAQLEKAEKYLANLVETIPQGILNIDCSGRIIFANTAAERIFGLPKEELINRTYNDPLWHMRTAKGFPVSGEGLPLDRVLQTGEPVSGIEYIINGVDGFERVLDLYATPLQDSEGNITGVVVSLDDITLRKQMEEQLKYISLHDSLTGLYNRAYFEEEMRRMSSGYYNPVGIIIIDIDGLKLVNDTFGHEQGDKLLQLAAHIIKGCFSENEVVARIGGDEFAVLLPFSSKNKIEKNCHRLRKEVEKYNSQVTPGFKRIPLSISIGCAVNGKADLINVFKEADNNMYREKLHHHQSARSTIVDTLVRAMEARDFTTEGHAARLRDLVRDLAEGVQLPERSIADLILLAQFHDVGKVGIPDRILFKMGPLTPKETVEMRRHCEIGHRIAQSSPDLVVIADWILKHHEWWNGEGYPLGLKGEEIPRECRILALVDAYDAMTSNRPYRKALTHEEAVAEIMRCSGTQFDPKLVEKFLQLLDSKRKMEVEWS